MPDTQLGIIDFHCHISRSVHACAGISDVVCFMEKFGIIKTVLLPTYFPHKKNRGLNNRELLALAGNLPGFICFGSLDAENNFDDGIAELKTLLETREIQGIKLYPGYQNFDAGSKAAQPLFELAQAFNVPLIVHCGEINLHGQELDYDPQWYSNPGRLIPNLKCFPGAVVIIPHLAMPVYHCLLEMMAEYPNLYTDISGLVDSNSRENIEADLQEACYWTEIFHKTYNKRVLFGTDFPIQSHTDSLKIVEMLGLGLENIRLAGMEASVLTDRQI